MNLFLKIAMVGNGMEGFRYSVQNGEARKLRNPFGSVITRSDGTKEILRDYAIPSYQFQPQYNASTNRAALPAQGFMYVLPLFILFKNNMNCM